MSATRPDLPFLLQAFASFAMTGLIPLLARREV